MIVLPHPAFSQTAHDCGDVSDKDLLIHWQWSAARARTPRRISGSSIVSQGEKFDGRRVGFRS